MAAAKKAYYDNPPPPPLELAWQCQRYHCLPDPGGFLDQDYSTVLQMTAVTNVHDAIMRFRNARGPEIHNVSDSDRAIFKFVLDEGLLDDG